MALNLFFIHPIASLALTLLCLERNYRLPWETFLFPPFRLSSMSLNFAYDTLFTLHHASLHTLCPKITKLWSTVYSFPLRLTLVWFRISWNRCALSSASQGRSVASCVRWISLYEISLVHSSTQHVYEIMSNGFTWWTNLLLLAAGVEVDGPVMMDPSESSASVARPKWDNKKYNKNNL